GLMVASLARGILDAPLDITRFDPVHVGDYLTLRRLAARARAGALSSFFGMGPANALAQAVWSLSTSLETEVGRCYGKMRAADQASIDTFAASLKRAASAAQDGLSVPVVGGEPVKLQQD